MGATTGIGWTDATWNPTYGCTRVSAGCDHCYAMTLAHRFTEQPGSVFAGTATGPGEPVDWTGKVNIVERNLTLPLRWRDPRMIFVNSQSDLFHAEIPDGYIAAVFAVMAAAPHHTFQVLTKRHGRMRALVSSERFRLAVDDAMQELGSHNETHDVGWPLPNVWLGVSVEDNAALKLRTQALHDTPAAVRFLSAEPLIGPLGDLLDEAWPEPNRWIDWVIVGGESGPGARPMAAQWARDAIHDAKLAGAAVFFKQTGSVLAAEWDLPGKGDDPAAWPVGEHLPRLWPLEDRTPTTTGPAS